MSEATMNKIKRGDVLHARSRVSGGACDRVYVTRVTAAAVYGVWEDDDEPTEMRRDEWSFTPATEAPITFTVRPEGCTAWATGLPTLRHARQAARKALDAGLRLVAIIRDEDGKRYSIWPE